MFHTLHLLRFLFAKSFWLQVSKLSYEKYLREVMAVLMMDKEFVKKMVAEGRNVSDKVILKS